MNQMTLGQLGVLVGCVTLLCVAVIFSQSKSEAQEQAISDPRNRISIPPKTRQSIITWWDMVVNRSRKTAGINPVAVLIMKEVTMMGPGWHQR